MAKNQQGDVPYSHIALLLPGVPASGTHGIAGHYDAVTGATGKEGRAGTGRLMVRIVRRLPRFSGAGDLICTAVVIRTAGDAGQQEHIK